MAKAIDASILVAIAISITVKRSPVDERCMAEFSHFRAILARLSPAVMSDGD
ncbi:hypothetical protein [Almyronema epifaneia]|uniref:PIN domain-containing protein n=1 Tax=Almyronema epifaneia S1 TaxID=2991925 RepID=A0ABW6I955_9CYAN